MQIPALTGAVETLAER